MGNGDAARYDPPARASQYRGPLGNGVRLRVQHERSDAALGRTGVLSRKSKTPYRHVRGCECQPFFAAGGAYGFAVLTWVHDPPFETPCSRAAVAV